MKNREGVDQGQSGGGTPKRKRCWQRERVKKPALGDGGVGTRPWKKSKKKKKKKNVAKDGAKIYLLGDASDWG